MTLDNMTGITKGSYTWDTFCKSQLITCNRVKECNGVCPFEDALQHADKMQAMDEQHIINHDREWIIGCIEHDGFIHTNRFDKANKIIHDALSAESEWIPVGERLPKNGEVVLVWMEGRGIEFGSYSLELNDEDKEGWEWLNESGTDYWEPDVTNDIVAWMPLPKPYREDGEA